MADMTQTQRNRRTVLTAGFIGNVVEWYDFALYGFFASVFSTIFFPAGDGTANLIAVYGIFAAGFVMRPLGSVLFGWLGDTLGRSRTMMISVALMAIPTFALGCLPVYDQVGLAAPIMLVFLRLVQGLSVGGEFSTSVVYLVETAPVERRGLSGSAANMGAVAGTALGSLMAMAMLNLLPEQAMQAWGWRIPYFLGGAIGVAALWLRRQLPCSPAFQAQEAHRTRNAPIMETLTRTRAQTLQATLFAAGYGVFYYITMVYFPNWVADHGAVNLDASMRMNTAALAMMLPVVPLAGVLGDKLMPRKWLVAVVMLVTAALAWPALVVARDGSLWTVGAIQFGLALLLALLLGGAPALFAQIFPARNRNTGYSISYALGMGIAGGATPMFATWLIKQTGMSLAPAALLAVAALIAAGAAAAMPERDRIALQGSGAGA